MKRFFKKLFKRGDFMTRADKAYYGHKFKTMFWSVFSLFIISWVGTNLVLCALTTNVQSNWDIIYEAEKEVTLPCGTEFNRALKGATSFSFDPMYEKITDRTITSLTFDKFTDGKEDSYVVGGVNILADATKETLSAEDEIYLYRTNNGANVYVLSNKKMQANPDSSFMFYGLGKCETFAFNNFNTFQVTNMMGMFAGNNNNYLYRITWPSVPTFPTGSGGQDVDTGTVSGVKSLDLSGWDTSKVTNMFGMFAQCTKLQSLDLSFFDTSAVTNMGRMFEYDESLKDIKMAGWDTSNVTDMSYMFAGIISDKEYYELDLSSFDTRSVIDMTEMFSNLNFDWCEAYSKIYVSDRFVVDQVEKSSNMFYYCRNLIGGKGTECDYWTNIDKTYARIDGGPNSATPGYFTEKPFSGKLVD